MDKIDKIDFILHENKDKMLIFRFLPQKSSCHSFNDNPPTMWREVYKVYYAYEIIKVWKADNFVETEFYCDCDECSIIDEVSTRIKYIIEGKKTVTVNRSDEEYVIELLNNEMMPFGDGVSWIINEVTNTWNKEIEYEIVLWKYGRYGYRFYIGKDTLKEFGEYLEECCEYMLAHGDPI